MSEAERPTAPPPAMEPAEEPEKQAPSISVEGAATRCPYCHENVEVEREAWTVCASCLARHHEGCWSEHSCCASCSGTTPLTLGHVGPGRLGPVPVEAAQTLDIKAAYKEARALYSKQNMPLFLAGGLSLLLNSASSGLLGGLTGAGLWSMILGKLRGQGPGRVADLFAHAGKFVPLLLAMLATLVLTLLATPLLVVGAILVAGGLGYTLPLIAERGLDVKDALKTSWRLARSGGLLKHGLLALLTGLPALALLVPVLGIVVYAALTPYVYGVWAAAYRQVTGEGAQTDAKAKAKAKADPKDDPKDDPKHAGKPEE